MSATQAKVIIVWNISGISPVSQVTLKVNTYFVVTGSGRGGLDHESGVKFPYIHEVRYLLENHVIR